MPVRDLLVLLNSPNRDAKAERALQKTREALETALEQVGNALGAGRADELKRILSIALNLSRAKGAYEGLCEGTDCTSSSRGSNAIRACRIS
jgi:hypothetical protein